MERLQPWVLQEIWTFVILDEMLSTLILPSTAITIVCLGFFVLANKSIYASSSCFIHTNQGSQTQFTWGLLERAYG